MSLSSAVKLVQVTDSHLFDTADKQLIGVNTDASLQAIVELLAKETNLSGVLATGDLSQDGSLSSYQRFVEILDRLNLPIHWLPGNHDQPDFFHQVTENFPLSSRSVLEFDNWRILMLDSVIPGSDSGLLARSELDYIEKNIHQDGKHHLLVLHHQPVPCDSQWLDTMILENSDELFQLLSTKPSVRALIHGHIHQDLQKEKAGIKVFSCPSTCFQFTPNSNEFSIDSRLPGYRLLTLMDDGQIETEVVRLSDFELNIEVSEEGY